MIAEIEHQHIVVRRELLPEWQVGVGRKAVAVGDREAHAFAIAVPPDANARAIFQDDIKRLARHRKDEIHSLALRYSDCGTTHYAGIAVCLPARSLILSRSAVVARRRRVTVLLLHPGCKSSSDTSATSGEWCPDFWAFRSFARKIPPCCPGPGDMPMTCRFRRERCTLTSFAPRTRTPRLSASMRPRRWRRMASGRS